ncbi:hypothetical protein Q4557_05230 [Shewanella sp. 5_MG-2023]|nr:hypothetical protein [Shewanella sp. 5_MG-2023]MDO6639362.1 hypothetical protein [Shewanella sp. 5_MG-2023]
MLLTFLVFIFSIVALLVWYLHKVSRDISQIDWGYDDDEIL